jgi:hypothetical protein
MPAEIISELLALLRRVFADLVSSRPWLTLALIIGMMHIVYYVARKYLELREVKREYLAAL